MNNGPQLNYAPPIKRVAATAIDLGILSLILTPLLLALSEGNVESLWPYVMNSFPAWLLVIGGNLFILDSSGQTIGKRIMKLSIVSLDGSRTPFTRLVFLRYLPFILALLIPYLGPLALIALAVSIFRKNQLGFHDQLARTCVVIK